MREYLKDRYNILAAFFILFGAVIVFQLVNLQIINGKYYDEQSQKRILNERSIPAPRGNIKDRYGVPIAVNRIGYAAEIVKTKMTEDERNDMLLRLVKIFEKNGDSYVKSLNKYLTVNPIAFGTELKGSEKKIQKWKEDLSIDKKVANTPEAFFKYMRDKMFQIDSKYSDEDAYKIMCIRYEMFIRGYGPTDPLCLAEDIKVATVAELEERHQEFPGVTTDTEPYREYIDGETAANVVGYVRKIDPDEYNKLKDEGYKMNDVIGKTGIEASAEAYLKGKEGQKRIEVDISGRQTEELEAEAAIPGNDVFLTLDMRLQKIAMDSLKKNIDIIKQGADGKTNFGDASAGAAVAMDVNTGEILAMASYPSYNPSVFLEGPSNKEAQKAILEYLDPKDGIPVLFNRAIQGTYAPGSTFKPLVGVAGLEEGAITPNTIIHDSGVLPIGNMIFKCLEYKMGLPAHGDLKLKEALETSCNIYFHQLGLMTTIDKIDKWAKMFGLGEYTDIDIPNEKKGTLASREFKQSDTFKKIYGRTEDWWSADTAQAAIGQSFNLFTPLQLVDYTAALANGGKKITPTLIKKVNKYDGSLVLEKKPDYENIPVKKETLNAIKEGMKAVTQDENGTAVGAFQNFPIKVAGKTGTAETGGESSNKSSNALFICYAPVENPQIAVAVVVEHGAWGSNTAWIARDILSEYFGLNGSNNTDDVLKPEGVEFTH